MRSLPTGWRWAKLGDIGHIVGGIQKAPNRAPERVHRPYLTVRNVQRGYLDLSQVERFEVTPAEIERLRLESGDLLIVEGNGSLDQIGRNAIFHADDQVWIHQNHIIRVRLDRTAVIPEFAGAYLNSPAGIAEMVAKAQTTSGLYTLSPGKVAALEIPLAPLSVQESIARRLRELQQAIQRARASAEQQQRAARAVRNACIRELIEGDGAQGWPRQPIGELLTKPIRTGISKSAGPGANKRCLTLSAVRGGVLDLDASKPADVTDDEAEGNWVTAGAFYVVRGNGNRALVGRGALAPATVASPVLFPDLLFEVVCDPFRLRPDFLALVWESRPLRDDIESRARTSAGIYKINRANLSKASVPVPSLVIQQRVAGKLGELLAGARRLVASTERSVAEIDALPAALLRRAFEGDL